MDEKKPRTQAIGGRQEEARRRSSLATDPAEPPWAALEPPARALQPGPEQGAGLPRPLGKAGTLRGRGRQGRTKSADSQGGGLAPRRELMAGLGAERRRRRQRLHPRDRRWRW